MTDRESRERLIELLRQNKLPSYANDVAWWCDEHIGEFADHLLANGVVVLTCRKGTVLNRNGEKCIANHWNIVLTAFNEDNHVRLFDIEEAEKALKEREKV